MLTSIFTSQALCKTRTRCLLSGTLLLFAGCAVGPDFHRPPAPSSANYGQPPEMVSSKTSGKKPAQAPMLVEADIPAQWWIVFQSSALNELQVMAIKSNPDLQAARAALQVANENVYAQQGNYYPNVQGNLTSTRQKISGSTTSNASSGASLYTLHTGQISVSYMPDIFGANRRQVESLQAQADAQRFELEAAHVTLTSSIAQAAIQEASLRGQMDATQKMIALTTQQVALMQRQRDLGAISEASLLAQKTALAQVQATLPPLRKQLAQQRDVLMKLTGRTPDQALEQTFDFSLLQLPAQLPLSLPSQLVNQRPDILAAEAQLHEASAQVGVAVANFLPQITLTASGGSIASELGQLLSSPNSFWSVAGGLTQPLFEGGTLIHKKRAAEAAYDQAAAQYRSTVLSAFQNVADTLHALQEDSATYDATLLAEQTANKSFTIAQKQKMLGDISMLEVLNAQQSYLQATMTRLQAQANLYSDAVALFQSLGGGWWNRQDKEHS